MRKVKNLTQEDLAHESEIDRSYIGGVERGERNLSFDKLCQIAAALGQGKDGRSAEGKAKSK
jgi:transcriptional regulator with XRE-family HTH domain